MQGGVGSFELVVRDDELLSKRRNWARAFQAKAGGMKERQIPRKGSSSGRKGVHAPTVDEGTEARWAERLCKVHSEQSRSGSPATL